MVAPDPADELSAAARRVRALHELLTAYDHTLSDGAATTAALTPLNWHGSASEAYQRHARTPFEGRLQAVHGINARTLETVTGSKEFHDQLAKLWQDPRERPHMRQLRQVATNRLAEFLLARAADLDQLSDDPTADALVESPSTPPFPPDVSVGSPFAPGSHPEPSLVPDASVGSAPTPVASLGPSLPPNPLDSFTSGSFVDSSPAPGDSGGSSFVPGVSVGSLPHPAHPITGLAGPPDLGSVLDPLPADDPADQPTGGDPTHQPTQPGYGGGMSLPGQAVSRDEAERASYLRALSPLPRLRTDIIWDGED